LTPFRTPTAHREVEPHAKTRALARQCQVSARQLERFFLDLTAGMIENSYGFSHPSIPVHRPDRILVQPKPGISPAALANFHAAQTTEILQVFERLGRLQVQRVPDGQTVESLIDAYERSGLVEFAEPDYIGSVFATPNDPKYLDGTLWGLNNTGQNGGTPGADTNMWVNPADGSHGTNALAGTNNPNDDSGHGTMVAGVIGAVGDNAKGVVGVAWQGWARRNTANNVIVAVIDTGVRYTHQDLAANMWTNPAEVPGNGIDDDGKGQISDAIECIDYATWQRNMVALGADHRHRRILLEQ
jgi:hypothetical protein